MACVAVLVHERAAFSISSKISFESPKGLCEELPFSTEGRVFSSIAKCLPHGGGLPQSPFGAKTSGRHGESSMVGRKGARTVKTVDAAVLKRLNEGTLETANLVEGLAMDLGELASAVGITREECPDTGIVKRMAFYGSKMKDWRSFESHASDTVRGFACYAIAGDESLDFASKLDAMSVFASDRHFGVREWAWLALRESVRSNLPLALKLLQEWTDSDKEGVRRFASEATRPRGVWCSHIEALKAAPEQALPLLNRLKEDPSKYVQNSVGNWLNDAANSQPQWVKKVAKDWLRKAHPHTAAIVKRGLRSFR